MIEEVKIDLEQPYPVFPLNNFLLLPETVLPLHIFEPRYLTMVRDALDSTGLITMAFFQREPDEASYLNGCPELRPCAAIGRIVQYEQTVDGRYIIVLQGVCRVVLKEEIYNQPYRLFKVSPFDVATTSEEALAPSRDRIVAQLQRVTAAHGGSEALETLLREVGSIQALVDRLIVATCFEPDQKYRMLAERDPAKRAEWVANRLEKGALPSIDLSMN